MPQLNLQDLIFTDHALEQINLRGITVNDVMSALADPQEILLTEEKRIIVQNIIQEPTGRNYLLRIFIDIDRAPHVVVTAYRTSKIEKYRSIT
jgi:hypothetical protein